MSLDESPRPDDSEEARARREATDAILSALGVFGGKLDRLTATVANLEVDVRRIHRDVYGTSDPPPPGDGPSVSRPPIAIAARQGSAASFDVAEVRGELLAVRAELARQSSAMGLGLRGLRWLTGPEGRAVALRLATLAGIAYTAFHVAAATPDRASPSDRAETTIPGVVP